MGMAIVTLEIAVRDIEADLVIQEIADSHIAQTGLMTINLSQRDPSEEEKNQIYSELPDDIVADLEKEAL